MRAIVDVAATTSTALLPLFFTWRLINQYRPVPLKMLQLVGFAAMLFASKFERICLPEVQDFVYFTTVAYTKRAQ